MRGHEHLQLLSFNKSLSNHISNSKIEIYKNLRNILDCFNRQIERKYK